MFNMFNSWDMGLMWTVYILEIILTVALMVNGGELHEMGILEGSQKQKEWYSELWRSILVVTILNLITGFLVAFYFGYLKPKFETTYSAVGQKCENLRLQNITSPSVLQALMKAVVILVGGLGYLLIFYILGVVRASIVLTMGQSLMDKLKLVYGITLAITICKVVELYIGHGWAALRTECLESNAKKSEQNTGMGMLSRPIIAGQCSYRR